jgi:hypothetical protein
MAAGVARVVLMLDAIRNDIAKQLLEACTVPDYNQPKVIYARVPITAKALREMEAARQEERLWARRMRQELGMRPIRVQRVLQRLYGRHFRRVMRQELAATVADLELHRSTFPWWQAQKHEPCQGLDNPPPDVVS